MRKVVRTLACVAAAFSGLVLLSLGTPAVAEGSASIDHVQTAPGQVKLLVSVPGKDPVDLESVVVHIGRIHTAANAEDASSANDISRTTVLAIDTSNSMAGARITEAQKAANAYLDQVPDNVKVGIVTFDSQVRTRLAPTLDRNATRQVIASLTLSVQTHLYDGVVGAVRALGRAGQRQILLLSDGKDTTSTDIASPITSLKKSNVKLDVVSLQRSDAGNAALNHMAQVTGGQVINAQDPQALSAAFASEADVLARQVLVTATVPKSQTASDATVEVSLTAGDQTYTDSAYVRVRPASRAGVPPTAIRPVPVPPGFVVPSAVMLAAVGAIGLGSFGVVGALLGKPTGRPATLEDHIGVYGVDGSRSARRRTKSNQLRRGNASLAVHATQAAEHVLSSNRGLEARVTKQLEGAGVSLRPSEWLLLHSLIAIACTAVGVLLAATSPVLIVVLLAGGVLVPWVYLSVKRTRRLSAFSADLADSLQLMSGSLSAGLSLAQSLDTIVREGSEPIASEYRRVIVETRLGVPLEDALEGVADRMQSHDFRWVVMAIRIQREVGGNLAELLLTVAATLREREYLRRHAKGLSAEGRLSCWILGGLPPVFLLYLTVAKPAYVAVLYTTPIGWVMLAAMAVMLSVGIFWMSKVAKVDV